MRGKRWLCVVALLAVICAASAPVAAEAGIAAERLIYQGAGVETQVDVNGAAAVQLVGGAIDAIAAQAQEAARQIQTQGGAGASVGRAAMLPMVLPMIEPAKEAIKSLERITVLVMKPKATAKADEFIGYYSGLMTPQGWTPLVTVRDKDKTAVLAMIAPEAKGVFFAVNDKKEMVAGLITTTRPIGDILGQLINASGGAMPMILSQLSRPKPTPPPAPAKPAAKPAPAKAPAKK